MSGGLERLKLPPHKRRKQSFDQTTLALRMLGAKEAVPTLKSLTPHPSSQTRCWVLQAIGTLGTKEDVPFLAKYLYDANDFVDMCAAQAVEEIAENLAIVFTHGPRFRFSQAEWSNESAARHRASAAVVGNKQDVIPEPRMNLRSDATRHVGPQRR